MAEGGDGWMLEVAVIFQILGILSGNEVLVGTWEWEWGMEGSCQKEHAARFGILFKLKKSIDSIGLLGLLDLCIFSRGFLSKSKTLTHCCDLEEATA